MEFFLHLLLNHLGKYSHLPAFFIGEKEYSYLDLKMRISSIQSMLWEYNDQQYFGVVTRNSIDTFATIFALWLSGKTMVPVGTKIPRQRNEYILERAGIRVLFDASDEPLLFPGIKTLCPSNMDDRNVDPVCVDVPGETDLYVLFTSGSTGYPKGVRITRDNFQAYLEAFFACGYAFSPSDRCLEVFDLTFDASVQCYTFPLLVGASVFTLPDSGIRFLSILKILQEQNITFVKMTPSVIFYLQPYFGRIHLPHLRYCLFGAEAFPAALVGKWQNCIPRAEIHNVYGPTEATINCSMYPWKRDSENKVRNGIASIGKPYRRMHAIVCDEKQRETARGTAGELCFSGPQITPGYLNDPENNQRAFFYRDEDGKRRRYYRTGDLAIQDEEGDLYYIGRIDAQVQIEGHRVELGEIEHHAHQFTGSKCIALAAGQPLSLYLFVESDTSSGTEELYRHLRKKIPPYMIPAKMLFIPQIPLLVSGKTDRQKLFSLIEPCEHPSSET